jgi:hypothetical protein
VESSLGYIEYEICQFLHLTPKELGKKRKYDPTGIQFLELHMAHRWNKEAEERKKLDQEMKRKR